MAHINSVEVKTAEGTVEVTKTSTHRDYAVASILVRADDTEAVLVWHLTTETGAKYIRSAEATRQINYRSNQRNGQPAKRIELREVKNTLTGRAAKEAAPEAPAPAAQEEAPAAAPVAETGTTGTNCRCGCGEVVGAKSQYRPGHDARHAGIVARDIASSASQYFERVTADSDLGSEALVRKAHAMADRLIAKQAKKASK